MWYHCNDEWTVSVHIQHEKWCKLTKCEMTVMDALFMLDSIVDESDPDVSTVNSLAICSHVLCDC